MPQLYRNESSDPKINAQRNLCGRTHYVDDDTLRFHKSRVLSARHTDGGLLFAIVTSDAADFEGKSRVFRYTIFDVFGTVIDRPSLENGFRNSEKATAAMWDKLNSLNAAEITLAAIEKSLRDHASAMAELRITVGKLITDNQTKG